MKKRLLPGSPCRPARPLSWLSIRLDSCLSVPITWRPPKETTSVFSRVVIVVYSHLIAWKAVLNLIITGSSEGIFSQATDNRSSTSELDSDLSPQFFFASTTAELSNVRVSCVRSHGNFCHR